MRIVAIICFGMQIQYIYMRDDAFCAYQSIQKIVEAMWVQVVFWGLASHFDQE